MQTSYLIFVSMSQQVVSTDTTTTLTLNSTGQHLIEISAVNECGFVGGNASVIVNVSVAWLPGTNGWVGGGGGGRQTNIHLHGQMPWTVSGRRGGRGEWGRGRGSHYSLISRAHICT